MPEVFDLLKLGNKVESSIIEAIPGYFEQLNAIQEKLDKEGKPYEVRYKDGCYVLERLTHEEAVEADIEQLQQYVPQTDLFMGTKYERLRRTIEETRQALVAKGIVRPKQEDVSNTAPPTQRPPTK